jgi:hypothetical protein
MVVVVVELPAALPGLSAARRWCCAWTLFTDAGFAGGCAASVCVCADAAGQAGCALRADGCARRDRLAKRGGWARRFCGSLSMRRTWK